MSDYLEGLAIGAMIMTILGLLIIASEPSHIIKSDKLLIHQEPTRADTFNGRWMPMLPPAEIRTEAPHCVITLCKVV